MTEKDDTFVCAHCGGEFTDDETTEEERDAEYRANFAEVADDNLPRARVCDECYNKVMGWLDAMSPEQRAAMADEARNQ